MGSDGARKQGWDWLASPGVHVLCGSPEVFHSDSPRDHDNPQVRKAGECRGEPRTSIPRKLRKSEAPLSVLDNR